MMIQLIYYFSPHSRHIQQKINSGIIPIQPHPHNFFQIENSTSLPHGEGENGFSNDRNDDRMRPESAREGCNNVKSSLCFPNSNLTPNNFFSNRKFCNPSPHGEGRVTFQMIEMVMG
jgi:hypothetical protein